MTNARKRRLPAEWERQSFIQFTFPHKKSDWVNNLKKAVICFVNIIEKVAGFEPVLVGCENISDTQSLFSNQTTFPIHFEEVSSNDCWARDHGAITVLDGRQPKLLNFIFNGWGNKFESSLDNSITLELSHTLFSTLSIVSKKFILEGGSIESDGKGVLLTTKQCLLSGSRNSDMTQSQIEEFLMHELGLKKILWLNHGALIGDDTDAHVDTLARFCAVDTIAYVKCKDSQDVHYKTLKCMEDELIDFKDLSGKKYKLVALPMPDACYDQESNRLPATYANFLLVNDGVLVPSYGVRQDQEALDRIQNIFPKRKVIGVDCLPLIQQNGSLHCISMQYPAAVKIILK
jgi:agmatine deiminase|tara:strand:+ start:1602 stop:2639 length:1038 start_codon:yes stop_codon:yes gene_type:complete